MDTHENLVRSVIVTDFRRDIGIEGDDRLVIQSPGLIADIRNYVAQGIQVRITISADSDVGAKNAC